MIGEARRCEVHGTALTSTGECILCARRKRHAPASGNSVMSVIVLGVVGAAITGAIGLRVHSALEDRQAQARPDSMGATVPATAPPADPAVALTPTATTAPALPSTSEPRVDPSQARREHELRVTEAARSVQIDLYGAGWCPSCRKARGWLDANAIPYTYRDTTEPTNARTMRSLNPRSTIPTINIEGQILVGFSPEKMRASIRRAAEARVASAAAATTP
jgi:glutaredoxin